MIWNLDAKWKHLKGKAGFPDGGSGGGCVFVILADGRELWRSKLLKPGNPVSFELSVEEVKSLEFVTEDGGDGNSFDWSTWFVPLLSR